MKINVHIDRLVLDGVASNAVDGEAVRSALVWELGRHLRTGHPSSGATVESLRASTVTPAASAAGMGSNVARAVHGTLMSGVSRVTRRSP